VFYKLIKIFGLNDMGNYFNYFLCVQVVVRPMMYVALTYDHRLIDGREAVTFLRKIKAAVEDPRVMLIG
jgi:pyruvate/2-oxoglutarate dehydrogenase complex dihydrolipoamide acyltransferase (E2) component